MAEKKARQLEQEESKIPVFTVIKNGAVLKNIFLINKSPPPTSISEPQSITSVANEKYPDEEILTVGRHPDCHIMLTHPSISRFHLQFLSKPSSQKLSVVDLSSVHGTWVLEKKIEPGVIVELNEGDTLKIGGSTRVYRLHWVPLSRAYDMDNHFVSPLDLSMAEMKEVEDQVLEEKNEMETDHGESSVLIENGKIEVEDSVAMAGKEEKTCQDEGSLSIEIEKTEGKDSMVEERKEGKYQDEVSVPIQDKATQSLDLILEGIVSLFTDEISELISKKKIQFSGTDSGELSLPAEVCNLASVEQQLDKDNQIPQHNSMLAVISEKENLDGVLRRSGKTVNLFASPSETKEMEILEEMESVSALPKEYELMDNSRVGCRCPTKESLNLSLVLGEVPSEIKTEHLNNENQSPRSLAVLQPVFEIVNNENSSMDQNLNSLVNQKSTWFHVENCCLSAEVFEESKNQSISRKGNGQKEIPSSSSILLEAESVNSSLPFEEVLSDIIDNKKCRTPQSLFAPEGYSVLENSESSPTRSGKRSNLHSIWSRRGKPASVLQIQTSKGRGKTKGDWENANIEWSQKDDMENKSVPKILFSGLEEMEEETFTPDKENFTPNTLLLKSLERKGKLEEIKHSKSRRTSSSKVAFSPNFQLEEDFALVSDKENHIPKVLRERKLMKDVSGKQVKLEEERTLMKARAERVPFQTLFVNSPGKSISQASFSNATTRSNNSVNFTRTTEVTNSSSAGEGRRSWTMVVDTSTLLDKESRKSLQLLQGLKGTQLIIPRMVIRELACLKRRVSLFRRTSEVSSVLEWIEECMVKSKWWIHIQSSVEEGRPIAPTPPASHKSQFSEGSGGFPCGPTSWGPFSSSRTSTTEIVSPTAEDHILDCALLFRKMKNDGHLVLLSNNVTMKIKTMAEGLICETAQEFRESLVNPFSERFLWADSSPRGLTWSHLDDVVLREKYSRGTLKKPSKGGDGAKGLKLILLHNSHYAQISSVR